MGTQKIDLPFLNVKIEFWCIFWLVPKCWNHPSFDNISPTVVIIATSLGRSSWVLHVGTPKNLIFLSKRSKIEFWHVFWVVPQCWIHPSFVNISPTVVIDTSMERSSWVLQLRKPKNFDSPFKKVKIEFWHVLSVVLKCWIHPSFVTISPTVVASKQIS